MRVKLAAREKVTSRVLTTSSPTRTERIMLLSVAELPDVCRRLKIRPQPLQPGPSADQRYPFQTVLESPPLLLFASWRRATLEDVRAKPLIIKSAGDVYRLDFYQALFPNARLHMLHLRRNPAASINGLINAWLSKKYQSFRVGGLFIRGYSDLAPWRRDWWKFDLFPVWQTYRDSSLAELCAAQWSTAQ